MIIGITGTLGAGKGTIVDFLKEKGFRHHSAREFITREIIKRGLEINRDNMVKIANEMRALHSPSYVAESLFQEAQEHGKDAVIESLRTPGEIEALRKKKDFVLLAVDADIDKRYRRITKRKTETDTLSFEEFRQEEEREMASTDPNKQNLKQCLALADYAFQNNGTVEELKDKVLNIIGGNKMPARPVWDEYFMKIAMLVSERSTCRRHHIGAVIVKNKRILTTGYNGAAAGTKDCLELGCLRDEQNIESGTRHEICRAIHAEQNAIIQAGLHGVNVENGIIYCTHTPCILCAKMLVNARIKRFVTYADYPDSNALKLFREAGIELIKISKPETVIKHQD